MGASINGVSKDGWFISWNIPLKWMMTGGTPISGNHHIGILKLDQCHGTGKNNGEI